ncbi:hypothetical protein HHI36_022802 [Cryptolaemus montrouzieri]|uniref:Uncharacterized protein n=1 Tax=Cryptolaemus montrouzieri TaxID=559131 RepID=A0ABD2PEZ7_9CUCU
MGEFSLSGNTNIGLSAVDISVNASKSTTNPIFFTTPSTTSGTDRILQATPTRPAMQDELADKTIISGSNNEESGSVGAAAEKISKEDCGDISDKLNEQVPKSVPNLFHHNEPSTPWSTAIDENYCVNGGLAFQNFSGQQQLFGNQNQGQARRAITASHNFSHNMGRQQSAHPMYKGFGSWANPGQSWSTCSSIWSRGRSVPNLTPLQQMNVAGRKPSPTFNHQQVISPVKFRRSTSYPGKGPFPQPPTFEITNMDEALPYQDRCGIVNANGSSPLENMRGLEHYLNDIIRPTPESTDMKGTSQCIILSILSSENIGIDRVETIQKSILATWLTS